MAGYYARFTRWVQQSAVYVIEGALNVDDAKEIAEDLPASSLKWGGCQDPMQESLERLVEFNPAGVHSIPHVQYMRPELDLYHVQNDDLDGNNRDLIVLASEPSEAYQLWLEYFGFEHADMEEVFQPLVIDDMSGWEEPDTHVALRIRRLTVDTSKPHALGWGDPQHMNTVAYALHV